MARQIDFIYDSEKIVGTQKYQLASGYISQTTIYFEKENLAAVIQAKGSVEFYDMDDVLIAAGKAPGVNGGKGLYQDVVCQVEDGRIKLQFPIYEWIDNYPHCDGEHDRWDTRIIGYHALVLDLSTKSIL